MSWLYGSAAPEPLVLTLSLPLPSFLKPYHALVAPHFHEAVEALDALTADHREVLWFAMLGAVAMYAYMRLIHHPSVPRVELQLRPSELEDVLPSAPRRPPPGRRGAKIPCVDPATGQHLGEAPVMSGAEVEAAVARARLAQAQWATTTFAQRRRLLRILSRCVLDHAEVICRVSARDSGKTMVDASFGEVLVTLEKLHWLCSNEAENAIKPECATARHTTCPPGRVCTCPRARADNVDCRRASVDIALRTPRYRSAGRMVFYKRAHVEWVPFGVVGAIVPWNYPFHNILNPVSAAVFTGNAIVVKVRGHPGRISARSRRFLTPPAARHRSQSTRAGRRHSTAG